MSREESDVGGLTDDERVSIDNAAFVGDPFPTISRIVAEREAAYRAMFRQFEAMRDDRDRLWAGVEALVTGPTVDSWRDEAAQGRAKLPYASNRYARLVDDLRALLADRSTR